VSSPTSLAPRVKTVVVDDVVHTSLTVTKTGKPPKTRRMISLEGVSDPSTNYFVYNNCIDTLERAVKERIFFVTDKHGNFVRPPQPTPNAWKTKLLSYYKLLKRYATPTRPMSRDEYLDCYSGTRKRAVYERAFANIDMFGGVHRGHADTTDFVKADKQTKPVPRVIRPAKPEYNVSIGQHTRPIEHSLYRAIDNLLGYREFGIKSVMKGLNMEARGYNIHKMWGRFTKPVGISVDGKRFDQHVSVDALRFEFKCYKLFDTDELFHKRLAWQYQNRGVGRCSNGRLKYNVPGTRTSGVSNTALGNVSIMVGMIVSLMMDHLGFSVDEFALVDDGDDAVIITEASNYQIISDNIYDYCLSLGFQMEVEKPVYELEQLVFCQSSPIYDGTQWVMVRDPRLAMAKDSICIKYLGGFKGYDSWIKSVSIGGIRLTGGIPVWQEFYRLLNLFSAGAKELRNDPSQDTGFYRMGVGMKRGYAHVSDEARVSFWKAFGICPESQISMENSIRKVILETNLLPVGSIHRLDHIWGLTLKYGALWGT